MTVDLSTTYLGLKLANPLVVAACPLTGELDVLQRLEATGAAAAVLPSLFLEQIQRPASADAFETDELGRTLSYFHELKHYNRGPDAYLRYLERAKKAVAIPLIGSLNGASGGAWLQTAKLIQDAGADALEMNLYQVVADPALTAMQVESHYVDLVNAVRAEISIPLAVKVGPYFTAFANMAQRLVGAGADGLVLFNRFLQPDIDVDARRVSPRLVLSSPDEERLPIRWIGILRKHLTASLAASGGIHFVDGIVKALLAGADVTMIASALYRNGVESLGKLLTELEYWVAHSEFRSVREMKGVLSHGRVPDPLVYERANYVQGLTRFVAANN